MEAGVSASAANMVSLLVKHHKELLFLLLT